MTTHVDLLNVVGDILEAADPELHHWLANEASDDPEQIGELMLKELRRIAEFKGECFGVMDGEYGFWPKLQFLTALLSDEGFTMKEIDALSRKRVIEIHVGLRMRLPAEPYGTAELRITSKSPGATLTPARVRELRSMGVPPRAIANLELPSYDCDVYVDRGLLVSKVIEADAYVMSAQAYRIAAKAIKIGGGR